MSRNRKNAKRGRSRQRHLTVHGVQRESPDLRKMSRAVIQISLEQAALEKAAEEAVASTASEEHPDA